MEISGVIHEGYRSPTEAANEKAAFVTCFVAFIMTIPISYFYLTVSVTLLLCMFSVVRTMINSTMSPITKS